MIVMKTIKYDHPLNLRSMEELVRAIGIMRQTSLPPEEINRASQRAGEIMSNPGSVPMVIQLVKSTEEDAIRHWVTTFLIQSVKDVQLQLSADDKYSLAMELSVIVKLGLPEKSRHTICDLIFVLVAGTDRSQLSLIPLAGELAGNPGTMVTGAYFFGLLLQDMDESSCVPIDVCNVVLNNLVPTCLKSDDVVTRQVGYSIINALASSYGFVEESDLFPIGTWFGQVAPILWERFVGFFGGNGVPEEFAEFAQMIRNVLDQCGDWVQFIQEMPKVVSTHLLTDVDPMILASGISILEEFFRNEAELLLGDVDSHIQALLMFARKCFEKDMSDMLPRDTLSRIAEAILESDEVKPMAVFGKYIGVLQNERTQTGILCVLFLIDAIFDHVSEDLIDVFGNVQEIINNALNPDLRLATPATVEAASATLWTIVEAENGRVRELLKNFEPLMLRFIESDVVCRNLVNMYDIAANEDVKYTMDATTSLRILVHAIETTHPNNTTHLENLVGAVAHVILLAEKLEDDVCMKLIPMLVAILQKHGAEVPAAIFCFGTIAKVKPDAVRGVMEGVTNAISAAMSADIGEAAVVAMEQVTNFIEIYNVTIKPAVFGFYMKARELYTKITGDVEADPDTDEYLEEKSVCLRTKESCLILMGMIVSTYTDLGTPDDIYAFRTLVTTDFRDVCACSPTFLIGPLGLLIQALFRRGMKEDACKCFLELIEMIDEAENETEVKALWHQVNRTIWELGQELLQATAEQYFFRMSIALKVNKSTYTVDLEGKRVNEKLIGDIASATITYFMTLGEGAAAVAEQVVTWLEGLLKVTRKGTSKGPILFAMAVVITRVPALLPRYLEVVLGHIMRQINGNVESSRQAAMDGLNYLIEAAPAPVLANVGEQVMGVCKQILGDATASAVMKEVALSTITMILGNSGQPLTGEAVSYVMEFFPINRRDLSLRFIVKFVLTAFAQFPDLVSPDFKMFCVYVFAADDFVFHSIPVEYRVQMAGLLRGLPATEVHALLDGYESAIVSVGKHLEATA